MPLAATGLRQITLDHQSATANHPIPSSVHMHVLFIHKNFPAQFRYIAPRLARDCGWKCTFLTEQTNHELPGVEKLLYTPVGGASLANHLCTRTFENTVAEASSVYETLKGQPQLQPDLIVAHAGFGSSLFLPYLYDAPIINFLEYYYRPVGSDLGYRPEMPVSEAALLRTRTRNAMLMLDLDNCTRGWTPTAYQRSYFPTEWQQKIDVIFDGIDTGIYYRRDDARARLTRELQIPEGARIVTYVARGFEFMRGFDIFMRSAKQIYEQFPDVVFVVVGSDRVCYGGDAGLIGSTSLREHILTHDSFNLSKFRFTGLVPEDRLADILSLSDVHIYLTEPFIASWSMVDAMSCGAVVLASDQICVREYISPGQNGLLVDFFDDRQLAAQAVEILRDPAAYRHLGEAARETVARKYSVDVAMPKLTEFFTSIAGQRRNPSQLASSLIRVGRPDLYADVSGDEVSEPAASVSRPVEPAPDDVSRDALRKFREMTDHIPDQDVIPVCQRFRGPAPWFEQVGPWNHPVDLTRLMGRAREWRPKTIVDIGDEGGGRVFLWARAAVDDARILVAGIPGQTPPALKMTFLNGLARGRQSVRCVTRAESRTEVRQRLAELLSGRPVDILFFDGCRPFSEVRRDFDDYSRLVRKGGLIGWDGIGGTEPPEADRAGGYQLWALVKPRVARHAEYLSGSSLARRGIALIVAE